MSSSLRIHTQIAGAIAIAQPQEHCVTAKWNATTRQQKMERAVLIPLDAIKAPQVPDAFRAIVESALHSAAESVLKRFCTENPGSFELGSEQFEQANLAEAFLQRGEAWLSKAELQDAFNASATWARIQSRAEFRTNATYQKQAQNFKDAILKLTGKAVQMPSDVCDNLLAKIEDRDFDTPFGAFVVRRLDQLKNRRQETESDFGAL